MANNLNLGYDPSSNLGYDPIPTSKSIYSTKNKKRTKIKKDDGSLLGAFNDGYDFGDIAKTTLRGVKTLDSTLKNTRRKIDETMQTTSRELVRDPLQTIKTSVTSIPSGINNADKFLNRSLDSLSDWVLKKDKNRDKGLTLEEYNNKVREENKNTNRQKINDIINPKYYNTKTYKDYKEGKLSSAQNYIWNIGENIGNMLPSMAVSSLLPTLGVSQKVASRLGSGLFYVQTQQSYTEEAKAKGYDDKKARSYGMIMGGVETIVERLGFDEIGGLKKLANGNLVKSMVGEGLEEFVTPYIDSFLRQNFYKDKVNWSDTRKEAVQGAILGAITGGIMNLGGKGLYKVNSFVNKVNNNQQITEQDIIDSMKEIQEKDPKYFDNIMEDLSQNLDESMLNDIQTKIKSPSKESKNISTVQDIVNREQKKERGTSNSTAASSLKPMWKKLSTLTNSNAPSSTSETIGSDISSTLNTDNIPQSNESVNNNKNRDFLEEYDKNTEKVISAADRNVIVRNYKQLAILVDEALDTNSNKALHLGNINETITQRIKEKLANLPKNKVPYLTKEKYDLVINQSEVRHLIDEKTKMTREDVHKYVSLLPKIISEFDNVSFSSQPDSEGIRFKKKLSDGTYISFVLVSNKHRTLKAKSIHLEKSDYEVKKRSMSPTSDASIAPNRTSKTDGAFASFSDNNIAQVDKNVKLPIVSNNDMRNVENNTLESENDKIAQLLDKRPLEKQKGLNEELNKIYQKIVDKGKYVADLAKKTGNKELYAKYDQMGTARGSAEYSIGVAQINNEGKKVGKSLIDIWNPIIESGKEFDFSLYLLHKHNIDRYRQGKPVFGEKITSEISQNEVMKYEENNPQFIEWSKDINKYNKNLLQNMVDAGITTEESQKYYNETYSNYVKIYRDITGNSPITIQNGKIKINSPIKTAKGGNQDILPLKDSMAQQTLEVTSAVRRNQFGLELLETLGNGKEVTEYGKEIIEKNDDGTYSFTVFKDGKPVKIEIDEGLYESIKTSKKSSIEDLLPVKGARVLLKFQRGLITDKNPFFLIRNFFKDLGDAPLNSKYTSKFFPNFARAYYEITTNGEYAQLYKALGGYQQSYFDNDSGLKIPSNKKTAKFIRAIQSLNQAVEMAPRLAEFISSIEAGETIQSSMYNAAEITTNFKRSGEVSKALNRNFSNFLNASIQGFDKQFRNFTGQNGAKGYINLLSKAVIFGVLPSILNHLLLDDDEDYEDLPDYIKDNYYLFKKSDNNFIRIPKGRVISIFGNAAYRTYQYLQGDKDAYKGFIENAITNVAPNNPIGSNVLSPFIQVATNKSWNGSEIVPQRLQDLPAAEQFDEKTDELSKAIGKLFNISPKKVNYLLDQYSGVFGDTLLPMMTPQAENNPLISAFTVNSVTTNKYSSEFYDIKDEVTKKANSVNSTVADELQKKYLNAIQTEMSELYKEKRELQMSDVKDSEKRKLVEKVQAEINKIAKEGLDNYQDVSSYSNYGKVAENEFYLNNKKEWTKVKEEEADELNALNMNADDKNKYFIAKNEITVVKSDENMNSSIKHTKIANIVMNSNLNDEYKGYLYGKYYSSEEKINNVLNAGISFDEYLKFNSQEFTTDYYTNGKAVPNSRKSKVIQYVNSLNLSIPQKALLIKMEYSSYDKYDKQIAQYINSQNLTFLEKASILKQAGFTSYDKQIIKYVNNMNITKSEKEEILEEMGFKIRNGRVYTK